MRFHLNFTALQDVLLLQMRNGNFKNSTHLGQQPSDTAQLLFYHFSTPPQTLFVNEYIKFSLMKEMTSQGHYPRGWVPSWVWRVGDGDRDLPRAPTEDTLLRWERSAGPGCSALPSVPFICREKEKERLLVGVQGCEGWGAPQAPTEEGRSSG